MLAESRERPNADAWFGRDIQGYDIYASCIYGARASILVGVLCTLGTVLIGGVIGVISGYQGGWADSFMSRIGDVFFAIPLLLGAIIFLVSLPEFFNDNYFLIVMKVVLALVILGWPSLARLMRSSVIQVKPNDYVQAARALGASPNRIIRSHVLPNSLAPMIVVATINLGAYIAAEATLVLPRDRPATAGHLVGHRDQRGARRAAHHAAHAVLPQRLPLPGGAGVHHAR